MIDKPDPPVHKPNQKMQIKTRKNSVDVSVKRHKNSVRVSLWSLTYLAGKLTRRSISRVQKNSVGVSLWSVAYVVDKTDPPVHLSHPGHKDSQEA